jgi:hypothetical protein
MLEEQEKLIVCHRLDELLLLIRFYSRLYVINLSTEQLPLLLSLHILPLRLLVKLLINLLLLLFPQLLLKRLHNRLLPIVLKRDENSSSEEQNW